MVMFSYILYTRLIKKKIMVLPVWPLLTRCCRSCFSLFLCTVSDILFCTSIIVLASITSTYQMLKVMLLLVPLYCVWYLLLYQYYCPSQYNQCLPDAEGHVSLCSSVLCLISSSVVQPTHCSPSLLLPMELEQTSINTSRTSAIQNVALLCNLIFFSKLLTCVPSLFNIHEQFGLCREQKSWSHGTMSVENQ